jgi:hypothetical protein
MKIEIEREDDGRWIAELDRGQPLVAGIVHRVPRSEPGFPTETGFNIRAMRSRQFIHCHLR